jgi:flagellar basal body-associated protein FliL
MTNPQPSEGGNNSKVTVIIISILWLLFLAGILGYNPYMKDKVPKKIEEKTELIKDTYEQKPNGVNQQQGGEGK